MENNLNTPLDSKGGFSEPIKNFIPNRGEVEYFKQVLEEAFRQGWESRQPTFDGGWKTLKSFPEWYEKDLPEYLFEKGGCLQNIPVCFCGVFTDKKTCIECLKDGLKRA